MILFHTRVRVAPELRDRVVRSLIRVIEPTRALPGCLRCRLLLDVEDSDLLTLEEEWSTREALSARLKSDLTPVLLAALECASEAPEVRFGSLSEQGGMEYIASCRNIAI